MFFDGSDVDESVLGALDPLPDGDYRAIVIECQQKQSRNDQSCLMYAVTFEIVHGSFEKRKVYGNFIFQHSNADAVKFGKARMKKLCIAAAGKATINGPEQLFSRPVLIRVKNRFDRRTNQQNLDIQDVADYKVGFEDKKDESKTADIPLSEMKRETFSRSGPEPFQDIDEPPGPSFQDHITKRGLSWRHNNFEARKCKLFLQSFY